MQLLPALESGGVERSTLEIADALVRAGHRAIVVSAGGRMVPRLLQDVLAARGFALSGWTLLEAQGISADGTALTGTGINPAGRIEAWYASFDVPAGGVSIAAVVPEPSARALGMIGLGGVALLLRARRGARAGCRRLVAGASSWR